MSIALQGPFATEWTRLADGSQTTIFTATKPTTVVAISFTETNGGTHTLAIARNDGTNDHEIRSALALTARERGTIEEVLRLDIGDTLEATSSSSSGYVHLRVTYLEPDATVGR